MAVIDAAIDCSGTGRGEERAPAALRAAGLLGRWEDHALALLFPLFQIATLLVLFGWLRRRGASRTLALAVTAAVSLFAPLYSAFMAGMAEIPAAFGFLLVGTAWSDALDRTDAGALRRLVFASLVSSATKNEGLFFVGLAFVVSLVLALRRREAGAASARGRWAVPLALLVPAVVSTALHRLALGSHPLRDLDFGYLFRPDFGTRLIEGLGFIARLHVRPSLGLLLALLVLIALGRRTPAGVPPPSRPSSGAGRTRGSPPSAAPPRSVPGGRRPAR